MGRAVGLAAVAGFEHRFQQAEQERAFKRVAERNIAVLAGQVVQHGQQRPAVREGHRGVELRSRDGGGGWGTSTGGGGGRLCGGIIWMGKQSGTPNGTSQHHTGYCGGNSFVG